MKRKKNFIWLIFVIISLLIYVACMVLVYLKIIEPYFPSDIMNTFNTISCVCLSIFMVICIISVINYVLKKNRPKNQFGKTIYKITNAIDKHKLSIISFLFAITIISVNAHIALWIPAVICSFALAITSWE